MKHVTIHSDGGCHGNPGPGGWAAVLTCGPHRRELSGGVPATTNNRMELQAAIEALAALKEPCQVDFYTDSAYVRNGISTWLRSWKRNGWQTQNKQPVKNMDLWQQLDACAQPHEIRWHWLKGHAGHAENERCDELAGKAIAAVRKQHPAAELKKLAGKLNQQSKAAARSAAFNQDPQTLAPLKDWLLSQNEEE